MNERSVSFEEFEAFLSHHSENLPLTKNLPFTFSQFKSWWKKISVCVELQERWITRIRLAANSAEEVPKQIESVRRVA